MSDSTESTETPKKRASKKAAAKKTAAKKAATAAATEAAPFALTAEAPPAKKAAKKASKKAAAKKAAAATPVDTAPAPVSAPPPAAAPAPVAAPSPVPAAPAAETPPAKKVAKKASKKAVAKKTAGAAPVDTTPAPVSAAPPAAAIAPPPVAAPAPAPSSAAAAPPAPVSVQPPAPATPRDTTAAAPPPRPEGAAPREDAPAAAPQGGPQHRPRPFHPQQGRPPHPAQQHQARGGQPQGEPRFDKHPRKRRRRGRDRWKNREHGDGAPETHAEGAPGPNGQPQQRPNFQRPPRPQRGGPEDRGFEPREHFPVSGPAEPGSGLLEISNKGFGFLRQPSRNYVSHPHDIFVTPEMVRTFGLRDGVFLEGEVRAGHRGPQLTEIKAINGREPASYKNLPIFEELTAINPSKRILLETEATRATTRIIDMVAPIGKGQRGLIVAPPRTGKTTLLQHIAEAISTKYPEMKLLILLVDERPEEVTEITRAIPQAEVYASSNDSEPKNHLRIAQVAIERAKRLVEAGEDVFIVLDSITRLARASNNAIRGGGSGRTMSGGIDARALELPRRLFASARNTREAGSLTIIGTALIETNSKADELIFQEFKGTGNMELVLDRKIAQQYVYPAVDIFKSGTRREELLLPAHQLEKINLIRRGLAGHKPVEAVERLLHFVRRHPNNAQMLLDIPKAAFVEH